MNDDFDRQPTGRIHMGMAGYEPASQMREHVMWDGCKVRPKHPYGYRRTPVLDAVLVVLVIIAIVLLVWGAANGLMSVAADIAAGETVCI